MKMIKSFISWLCEIKKSFFHKECSLSYIILYGQVSLSFGIDEYFYKYTSLHF